MSGGDHMLLTWLPLILTSWYSPLCIPSLWVCAGLSDLILTSRIWQSVGTVPPWVDYEGSDFCLANTLFCCYSLHSEKASFQVTRCSVERCTWKGTVAVLCHKVTRAPWGKDSFWQQCAWAWKWVLPLEFWDKTVGSWELEDPAKLCLDPQELWGNKCVLF